MYTAGEFEQRKRIQGWVKKLGKMKTVKERRAFLKAERDKLKKLLKAQGLLVKQTEEKHKLEKNKVRRKAIEDIHVVHEARFAAYKLATKTNQWMDSFESFRTLGN